jgi:hypothetical protein
MKKLFAAIFLLSLISCGPSTEVIKSWREPTATISADGSYKTLVIAMVKDEAARRTIEDNFVKRLKGTVVQSYTTLTPDVIKEGKEDVLTKYLNDNKFTHVLLMHLADIEKETNYVPVPQQVIMEDMAGTMDMEQVTMVRLVIILQIKIIM